MTRWYALVGKEVVGPFDVMDPWYRAHAGSDWRHAEHMRTGIDPWLVDHHELEDGHTVSTVFLGLDHSFHADGLPVVFETMVFPECEWCERASTWADAELLHAIAVASIQRSIARSEEQK